MPRHALVTALDRRLGPKFRERAGAIEPPGTVRPQAESWALLRTIAPDVASIPGRLLVGSAGQVPTGPGGDRDEQGCDPVAR
jgi:hypothetical protein